MNSIRRGAMAMMLAIVAATAAHAAAPTSAYAPDLHLRRDQPHPAVARIIVPEGDVTSYGSGTLIDVRDQFGLVITNWHVVRDGRGEVEVVFPDGFRSQARPLKVDADWDLAALVIWRPPAAPVSIAPLAPQSGDQLTICGYGTGQYRAVTGRCTQYYAPKTELPQHMVELDVEARQGDSGGPIFNDRGELAGVLFGAGGGTTLGSFGGRVESFLATLAPDIGRAGAPAVVQADAPPTGELQTTAQPTALPAAGDIVNVDANQSNAQWTAAIEASPAVDAARWEAGPIAATPATETNSPRHAAWFEQAKNILAAVGVVAIIAHVIRAAR